MTKIFFALILLTLVSCVQGTRYSLHEDNDYFKPTKNNDRDFSQGVRVTGEHQDPTGATAYYIGQNFYTPAHKQLTTYQPDDRPYAGYLYTGADFKYRNSPVQQDTFGITAGIIGPHAYAEQTQNTVHSWIGDNKARGWDNQIHDELGIILKAERAYAKSFNGKTDLVSTIGGNLGNVFTQAYAGSMLRYGYNLRDYFSYGDIIYPRGPASNDDNSQWSFYVYGGPWARAVLRNIFLDGNTFRDSPDIDKYPLIAEGRLGFALEYNQYRFAYTYVAQTKEYHGQEVAPNDFGEITLSVGW